MEVIKVDHLTKDYGSGRGVFDVCFSVAEGEVFGFLGPNGAGKSTTIRHLLGFSRPGSGETYIFGKPSFKRYDEILARVGYIPGEIALPQGLKGREFLDMMQSMRGVRNDELLRKLLDMFELDDVTLAGDTKRMSLGVKRKLAVVAAFMSDPAVLILDEPTSGLDPVMQEVFVDYIHREKERGKTILMSSHIFSEIDSTSDRIAIIKDGRIVSEFVANDLKHASLKYYNVEFNSPADTDTFLGSVQDEPFVTVREKLSPVEIELSFEDKDLNRVIALMSQAHATGFSNRKESLEDYFMKFYKEDRDFGGALA